jgi:myo-inositol catabolism protein IolC
MSDEAAVQSVAARFAALVETWSSVRDPRLDLMQRSAH